MSEHRSLHFCLIIVHLVLMVGLNAHFLVVLRDMRDESKACILMNPSSYTFFLAFGAIVIFTSILSVRQCSEKIIRYESVETIRKGYSGLLFLSAVMLVTMFLSDKFCKIKRSFNSWPIFWCVFSTFESILLITYISWFTNEVREIGFLEDPAEAGIELAPKARETKDHKLELQVSKKSGPSGTSPTASASTSSRT